MCPADVSFWPNILRSTFYVMYPLDMSFVPPADLSLQRNWGCKNLSIQGNIGNEGQLRVAEEYSKV